MVVPCSFSPWANLPLFVAEAFHTTACTWDTSRWYIWPKSYILKTLIGSLLHLDQYELLVHDTSVLTTQQFCRILATALGVTFHLQVLTFESFPQLLVIFLNHQWMDLTLQCCCMTSSIFLLPRRLIQSINQLISQSITSILMIAVTLHNLLSGNKVQQGIKRRE